MGFFNVKRMQRLNVNKVFVETVGCAILTMILSVIFLLLGFRVNLMTLFNSILKLSIAPVSAMWWYVPVYILVSFLSSYINNIMCSHTKKLNFALLLLVWLSWYAVGNLCSAPLYVVQKGILFYMIGAYINLFHKEKKSIVVNGITFLLFWTAGILCAYFGIRFCAYNGTESMQFKLTMWFFSTFIVPICAVQLFLVFSNLKINNTFINSIAEATFGIYLLHDSVLARVLIWNEVINVRKQFFSNYFPIIMIVAIVVVFVLCGILAKIMNKTMIPLVERGINNIQNKIKIGVN